MMRRLAAQRFEGKLTADECQEVVDFVSEFSATRELSLRLLEPSMCSGAAVFPLFVECSLSPHGTLDYLLSDEAMETGICAVSETGSVGELSIDNCGDRPVLFLEGEEVRGGKRLHPDGGGNARSCVRSHRVLSRRNHERDGND